MADEGNLDAFGKNTDYYSGHDEEENGKRAYDIIIDEGNGYQSNEDVHQLAF
jgi:hypothetical protein